MKPHKHAELIKAWADGATIQMKSKVDGGWWDVPFNNPDWDENYEYRIKPVEKKPVVRWLWVYETTDDDCCADWNFHFKFFTESEAANRLGAFKYKRLDWSATTFEE